MAESGSSKKDKIRIMWQNWVNVKRNAFTRWRINAAKIGVSLLTDNLKKDAMNQRLMKMILSSATGKMAVGMKVLREHNNELKELYGNKVDLVKRIINMFQTKTIVGLSSQALRRLRSTY